MLLRSVFLAIVLMIAAPALAEEPSMGPVIEGYGPTYPIDDRDVPLREGFVTKRYSI